VTGANYITDSLCHDNINLQVGCYLGRQVDLITCDAEAQDGYVGQKVLKGCFEIIQRVLSPAGFAILKTYLRPEKDLLVELSRLTKCFKRSFLIRLHSSRATSREVYYVGLTFIPGGRLLHQSGSVISSEWVSPCSMLRHRAAGEYAFHRKMDDRPMRDKPSHNPLQYWGVFREVGSAHPVD